MKHIITLIFSVFIYTTSAYSNPVVTGISEFIYGVIYLNIGATPCQEIITRSGPQKEKQLLQQINQLISTANSLIGKETINRGAVEQYATNLYQYCEAHPNQMFLHALLHVSKPMLQNVTTTLHNNQQSHNNGINNNPQKIDSINNSDNKSHNKDNKSHNNITGYQYNNTRKPSIEFIH